jgi:hypothetical protein
MRKVLCLVAFGCLALALRGEAAGVGGSGPAEKAAPKPTAEQLIERLGHRSYRVRTAAEKALAEMGADVLPALVKARRSITDVEVVRRLDGLIPALERTALLQPKRVTLHLDNKPIQAVLAEFTRQTGYAIDLDNNNANNGSFSFHFDKLPFWQALDKVCQQTRMTIYPYYYGSNNDRLRLYPYGTPPGPFVSYYETFRLVANGFHYNRSVNFSGSFTGPEKNVNRSEYLNFNFSISSEPKLPFLLVSAPVVTEAFDEMKRSMAPQIVNPTSYHHDSKYGSGSRTYSTSLSVALVRPSRDSKTAKLIRGEIPVVLLSRQKPEITVEKPLAVKKTKFKGGVSEIEIEDVTEANNWNNGKTYQVKMALKEETDLKGHDYAWQQSLQYRLELLDEKGTKYLVWSNSLYNRGPRQAQGTIMFRPPDNVAIGPPVKLVYNQWVPMGHRIKFEFRDLPLP